MKGKKQKKLQKTAALAFKAGDWVSVVRGPCAGKDTTITEVYGALCFGYYCGKLISFSAVDAVPYRGCAQVYRFARLKRMTL